MRALRDPFGLRARGHARHGGKLTRDGPQPRLDALLTPILACALASEERAARAGGARVVRVGLGARLLVPEEPLVAFGLAGALVPGLEPGMLLSARRIVDEGGRTLWEGEPLAVPGARAIVLCGARRVVDEPAEREALAARSGADAVDMESARLAGSGRLVGAVKAVSDTSTRRLARLAAAATPDGAVEWRVVASAFAAEPRAAFRAAVGARRALSSLERAAAWFAESTTHEAVGERSTVDGEPRAPFA